MRYNKWNKLRTRLNHDWLQNSYITFLMARAEYIDRSLVTGSAIREDIVEQFVEFSHRKKELEKLIKNTVAALSPAQLLEEPPFTCMPEDDKRWLRMVVDILYRKRTGIEKKADELQTKLKSTANTHAVLAKILKHREQKLMNLAGKELFKHFSIQIQELSRLISALPNKVQVA